MGKGQRAMGIVVLRIEYLAPLLPCPLLPLYCPTTAIGRLPAE
jgi:hypothetical protein